jgi:hypothetical protein
VVKLDKRPLVGTKGAKRGIHAHMIPTSISMTLEKVRTKVLNIEEVCNT